MTLHIKPALLAYLNVIFIEMIGLVQKQTYIIADESSNNVQRKKERQNNVTQAKNSTQLYVQIEK